MNTTEIKTVLDGQGHHSFLVVAVIDGQEIKTAHKHHTETAERVAFLRGHYDCVTVTKGW